MEDLDIQGEFYRIDFTERRTRHGPGHSRRGHTTVDFAIGPDGGFGEQTCAIWHRRSGYMAVQYNHYGVRSGAIKAYFSHFLAHDNNTVPMVPVLREDTYKRLIESDLSIRLTCGFDAESSLVSARSDEMNAPLKSAMQIRDHTGASNIEFTVSLGMRGRHQPGLNVRELVDLALRLNPCKLTAKAKADENAAAELLNLLEQRDEGTIDEARLRLTPGLRWRRRDRYREIQDIFAVWLNQRTSLPSAQPGLGGPQTRSTGSRP